MNVVTLRRKPSGRYMKDSLFEYCLRGDNYERKISSGLFELL